MILKKISSKIYVKYFIKVRICILIFMFFFLSSIEIKSQVSASFCLVQPLRCRSTRDVVFYFFLNYNFEGVLTTLYTYLYYIYLFFYYQTKKAKKNVFLLKVIFSDNLQIKFPPFLNAGFFFNRAPNSKLLFSITLTVQTSSKWPWTKSHLYVSYETYALYILGICFYY